MSTPSIVVTALSFIFGAAGIAFQVRANNAATALKDQKQAYRFQILAAIAWIGAFLAAHTARFIF